MLSGGGGGGVTLGIRLDAQIVERGHVVEQHAAGAVRARSNLNADLAADDAAEDRRAGTGGAVEAGKQAARASAAIARKAFMQAAAGVVGFRRRRKAIYAAPDIKNVIGGNAGKCRSRTRKHGGASVIAVWLKAF